MSPFGIGLWIEKFKSPPPLHWLEAAMNILNLHKFEYIQTRTGWIESIAANDTEISSIQINIL